MTVTLFSVLFPLLIAHANAEPLLARTTPAETHKIVTREQWGADDSLLFRAPPSSVPASKDAPSDPPESDASTPSVRMQECEDAQRKYPKEFRTVRKRTKDDTGNVFRWPLSYAKKVQLLVIHHTAVPVTDDTRSGPERIRALYQYHAQRLGWGDIGYHYLIDEDGQIYEGKYGGKGVVGGHAYCHNIGSIGIALLGNLDAEQPTQKQLASLQWLLRDLAEAYDIDLREKTIFHGKTMDPVVGHGDLLSTACPGYFVDGSLAQIRAHAASGDTDAVVTLPKPRTTIIAKKPAKTSAQRRAERKAARQSAGTPAPSRAMQRLLDSPASRALERKLRRARTDTTPVTMRPSPRSVVRTAAAVIPPQPTRNEQTKNDPTQNTIRIRLTKQETGASQCREYDLPAIGKLYRGTVTCVRKDDVAMLINAVDLESYVKGLAEEPDTEPYEKQRAFAIAARSYAAYYMQEDHRKFPGMPYDGSDSPATFQAYGGLSFERSNPAWVKAVRSTKDTVLMKDGSIVRAPYFSTDDGRTRSPEEIGWNGFPFAEIFRSKPDPWCAGETLRGHGVGMSGCGAEGQANDGKTAEEILEYYYPGTNLRVLDDLSF